MGYLDEDLRRGLLDPTGGLKEGVNYVYGDGPGNFVDAPQGLYTRNGMDVASDNAMEQRAAGSAYSDYNNPILPADWQNVDRSDRFIQPRLHRAMDVARAAGALRDYFAYGDPAGNNVFTSPLRQIGQEPLDEHPTAWATTGHQAVLRRQPLPVGQAEVEDRARYGIDELQDEQFPHAMRISDGGNLVETPQAARERINGWVRFNMQRAQDYVDAGNTEAAQFHLGLAKHAMQDATSPSHNNPQGDPAVWNAGFDPLGHLRHVLGEAFDPGPNSWAQTASDDIQRLFNAKYVPPGDLLNMYGVDTRGGRMARPGQADRPFFLMSRPMDTRPQFSAGAT